MTTGYYAYVLCDSGNVISILRLRLHESGTFWSRIRFVVYTQNMNPESKLCGFVMNLETFESGT